MPRVNAPESGYPLPDNVTPDDTICVSLRIPDDDKYRAAFMSALSDLGSWLSWEKSGSRGDRRASQAATLWKNLLDAYLVIGDCESALGEDCIGYGLNAPFVDFAPQNPYTHPDYRPTGYNKPPFYIVRDNDTIYLALGYKVGDVMTDITNFLGNFPEIIPTGGLPRIRVQVSGIGTIEFHILNVPLGSFAQIQVDGMLASLQYVDTNLDVTSSPIETTLEQVIEISLDTSGSHFVDLTFVPKLNDEIPFVNFGGGLRSIVLCGFDAIGDDYLINVRQREGFPCILDKTFDGINYEEFANLQLCPPKLKRFGDIIKFSGDNGETWTPIDYDETYDPRIDAPINPNRAPVAGQDTACLASANAVEVIRQMHIQICAWYDAGALAFALGGVLAVFMATFYSFGLAIPVIVSIAGLLISASAQLTVASFDSTAQERLRCTLYCNADANGKWDSIGFQSILDTLSASLEPIDHLLYLYLNEIVGFTGLNNAGTTTSVESANCSACDCGWCFDMNFLTSDYGFQSYLGSWVSGHGIGTELRSDGQAVLGGAVLEFAQTYISKLTITTQITATDQYANNGLVASNNGVQVAFRHIDGVIGENTFELVVNSPVTKIEFYLDCNTSLPQYATRLVSNGTGNNPFGGNNC